MNVSESELLLEEPASGELCALPFALGTPREVSSPSHLSPDFSTRLLGAAFLGELPAAAAGDLRALPAAALAFALAAVPEEAAALAFAFDPVIVML